MCRPSLVVFLLGIGCDPGEASLDTDGTPTDPDVEGDADADADGDSDADTDADGDADTDTGTPGCPPVSPATTTLVVTDIDETLTTSDNEWLTQIVNPGHDPEMRPDADTMIQTYFDKGYRPIYVTARGEGLSLLDGTSARDATEQWLTDHGFPFTTDGVFLAGGLGETGAGAATYKEEVLQGLLDEGYEIVFAYGNADTDIEAYQAVGIPDTDIFLVGDLAGQFGVVPIPTDEAYTGHLGFVEAQGCGF